MIQRSFSLHRQIFLIDLFGGEVLGVNLRREFWFKGGLDVTQSVPMNTRKERMGLEILGSFVPTKAV